MGPAEPLTEQAQYFSVQGPVTLDNDSKRLALKVSKNFLQSALIQ